MCCQETVSQQPIPNKSNYWQETVPLFECKIWFTNWFLSYQKDDSPVDDDDSPTAYPTRLLILSAIMVRMWFYNLLLHAKGFLWSAWCALSSKIFKWNLIGLKPPRPPKPRKPGRGLSRSKALTLAAFGLCSQMGTTAGLQLVSEKQERQALRKHRAYPGMLNTNSLSQSLLTKLQATLRINAACFYAEASEHAEGALIAYVDTGCSVSCTADASDFVDGTLQPLAEPVELGGIAGGLNIVAEGILCWETLNDRGEVIQFKTRGYHVPNLPTRLFSPQSFLKDTQRLDDHFRVWHNRTEWWVENSKMMTMSYDPSTFLPRITLFKQGTAVKVLKSMAATTTDSMNQNLSPLQKLWTRLHYKLGHLGFKHARWLGVNGALGPQAQRLRDSELDDSVLKCGPCCFGKQAKRPTGSKKVTRNPDKIGALSQDKLKPGQLVFMDQLESRVRGRQMHTAGHEREIDKFCGSTVFCDAASHYISVQHQVSLSASETLKAKAMFERTAKGHGVDIDSYHSDNGIFTAKEFVGELMSKNQGIRYSGVGAQHQNGQAENAIKIVTSRARTMMIHASLLA